MSLNTAPQQPEKDGMAHRHPTSSLIDTFHPPDLTQYIEKHDAQYVAGGGFGDVYKSLYLDGPTSREVAVKALRFKSSLYGDTEDKSVRMLRRELGIWKRVTHKNVVPFLGVAYGFGMSGAMSLVSLWMPNDTLHKFLAIHDHNLEEVHRLQILLDIAEGLHYLHSFPIVHGDLNSNNVLIDADYTARLADFGFASFAGNIPEALAYLQRSTARPGALRWIAPEQIEETFNRTTKSDIYSFGCVALQVLSGKQPWSEVREDARIVLLLHQGHRPGRPESRVIDNSHWNFIQCCWSSLQKRPAADSIIISIRRFLSDHPPSGPLRNLFISPSMNVDKDDQEGYTPSHTGPSPRNSTSSEDGTTFQQTSHGTPSRKVLLIQEEMVELKKELKDTAVGQELYSQLQTLVEMQTVLLRKIDKGRKAASEPAISQELQREYTELRAQIDDKERQMQELKSRSRRFFSRRRDSS